MYGTRGLAAIALTAVIACGRSSIEPSPAAVSQATGPSQAAYVWQRNWTPGVRDAVAHPPAGIDGLHVLIAEVSPATHASASPTASSPSPPTLTMMAVDASSLAAAHVPITLVVRLEGSRPIADLSLDPVLRSADALRAAGVEIGGIEIDHDCATARLADYAYWLSARRPTGYRFSITALPTWASSPALIDVAHAVDEIVVQVHAVRAPMIFDANIAWRDLTRFARAVKTPMRVALPTYSAMVRDVEVSVDPDDVAVFVDRLAKTPIAGVGGIVWFRLPVEGDEQTWSRATFARIVARDPVASAGIDARAKVELVAQGDQRFDVVVSNPTDALVEMPPVHIAGDIGAADMVMGYRELGSGRWEAPRRSLAHNERIVIGWIHGKDLTLVD